MISEVIYALMILQMDVIKDFPNPTHVSPENIPIQLTIRFFPASSLHHVIDSILERGTEGNDG
jgi:hypothetical protein